MTPSSLVGCDMLTSVQLICEVRTVDSQEMLLRNVPSIDSWAGTPHLIRPSGHQLCHHRGEEMEGCSPDMPASALQSFLMSTSRWCL